jgi:undecaprenyl-diphosphatase
MAIFPGISRSGITIVIGLWLGLSGATAARFSFLMALPAIAGAGLFKILDEPGAQSLPGLSLGMVLSAIVGYAVIAWLLEILRRGRLHLFAGYTLLAGLVVIFTF